MLLSVFLMLLCLHRRALHALQVEPVLVQGFLEVASGVAVGKAEAYERVNVFL